jgi:hypothetical protein
VRVNALASLRGLGSSCAADRPRRLLHSDPSWRVRGAAADWAWALRDREPTTPTAAGAGAASDAARRSPRLARALARCVREDHDAAVAARCAAPIPAPAEADPLLVFVVPHGATEPVPFAPFALELGDGALRLGVADRRGACFERAAPGGSVRLAEPGALAP